MSGLTDIQKRLLQLMKELDEVCRSEGIHYTLGGGTAIGAIRHRGFIPWDDDIDLYMTRDNWEKFKAAGRAGKLPAHRVIESAETDIHYTNTIGRYVATDSSSVHSHQIIYDDPAGHVIDVFVFDPLHYRNYRNFMEDLMLYSDLMDETKGYSSRFDMNLRRYPEALRRCRRSSRSGASRISSKDDRSSRASDRSRSNIAKENDLSSCHAAIAGPDHSDAYDTGKRQVIDELVERFTHMDDPGWEHYIMEWGVAPFLFPASIFDGGYIRVPFEDTTVEIVRNYTEYLIWQYGDDWQYIPPHEGREGHDAIFSNVIPYNVVRSDYLPFIDTARVRRAYLRRKLRLLRANPHRRGAEAAALDKKAQAARDDLLARLDAAGLDAAALREMLAAGIDELSLAERDILCAEDNAAGGTDALHAADTAGADRDLLRAADIAAGSGENACSGENQDVAGYISACYRIAGLFSDYFALQLSPEFAGRRDKHSTLRRYSYPVLIPLSEELVCIAAEVLMRTERMSKAKRLIEIYTGDFPENFRSERRKSERLSELETEILAARELANRYTVIFPAPGSICEESYPADLQNETEGDQPDHIEGLSQFITDLMDAAGRYKTNSYIQRLKVRLLLVLRAGVVCGFDCRHDGSDDCSYGSSYDCSNGISCDEEINGTLELLEDLCPQGSQAAGEVRKYIADFTGADADIYRNIWSETNSGLVRLEIEDRLGSEPGAAEDSARSSNSADSSDSARSSNSADSADSSEGNSPVREIQYSSRQYNMRLAKDGTQAADSGRDGSQIVGADKKRRLNLYAVARGIYRRIAGRDDSLKERAWEIACRTKDRVELLEMYHDKTDHLRDMMERGDWDNVRKEMQPHEEAVLRNLSLGLGLQVHPDLQDIQYEIFRRDGRAELINRIDSLVPEQHRRPISDL